MKNLLRQYWLPALLTVFLHLLAADAFSHWLNKPRATTGGVIEDPLAWVPLLPPAPPEIDLFYDDGLDDLDDAVFPNTENTLRMQKPPCLCCIWHDWPVPPKYVPPQIPARDLRRIDGIALQEPRMIIDAINGAPDYKIYFPTKETRYPKISRHPLNYTTRIALLGGRR